MANYFACTRKKYVSQGFGKLIKVNVLGEIIRCSCSLKNIAHGLDGNYRDSEKDTVNNYILKMPCVWIQHVCEFLMCDVSFLATLLEPVIYLCCVSVQPALEQANTHTHMPGHTPPLETWGLNSDEISMLSQLYTPIKTHKHAGVKWCINKACLVWLQYKSLKKTEKKKCYSEYLDMVSVYHAS